MISKNSTGVRTKRSSTNSSRAVTLQQAWQSGQAPSLESFVAAWCIESPLELSELIRIDLDARWSRNLPQTSEDYLCRFPIVASDPEAAVDVIYAEYLAREKAGDQPELSEFERRFPAHADVLAEQIQLHLALESFDDPTPNLSGLHGTAAHGISEPARESPGVAASYELLERIGAGGMGVVYKAYEPELNRYVALKMVRSIDADNPEVLTRFRSEARVVAALHHQNIVQVYDYGLHEGLPYIAMELVPGGSLADRLDGRPWEHRAAAELLVKLASAMQFAHERAVIHRDLKPANVLVVAEERGLEVKIADFGLAKLQDDHFTQCTKSIAFLGTPSYMAPEQACGRARDIGPTTDIYSLGAILYELLTGRPPYRGESAVETLRLLLSTEPISVTRLSPSVSRDLATICHKCLEPDPLKRYASAEELRTDLESFLVGKPILARPIGHFERTCRWCNRNPYLAASLASIALLLAGIAAVSIWYSALLSRELAKSKVMERAERAANLAAQQRLWNVYLSEATARNHSRQVGQRFGAMETIDKAFSLLDSVGRTPERELQLRNAVLSSIALPDIRTIRSISSWPDNVSAAEIAVEADHYVILDHDGQLSGFRLSDSQLLWSIDAKAAGATPHITRDGRYVAVSDVNGARVWRVGSPLPQPAWEVTDAKFLSFAPNGEMAAYSSEADGMFLVSTVDGAKIRSIGEGTARSKFAYHQASQRLAVCVGANVQIIDLETGMVLDKISIGSHSDPLLAWHPHGDFLAVWGHVKGIELWKVATSEKVLALPHRGLPARLAFNSEGSLLITETLWNQRLCVWDVASGHRVLDVPDFSSLACDVSSDRRIIFLKSRGKDAELLECCAGACRALAELLDTPLGYWYHASICAEGSLVACSSENGIEIWDLQAARRLLVERIGPCQAQFDSFGRLLVGHTNGVARWVPPNLKKPGHTDSQGGNTRPNLLDGKILAHAKTLYAKPIVPASFSASADGETLMFEDAEGWALMHVGNNQGIIRLQTTGDARCSAVSSNGQFAAVANWENGGATVWDARSGRHLSDLNVGRVGDPLFSPDCRFLALTPDGVTLWSTKNWKKCNQLNAQGTTPTGLGIAFSPDSHSLAVGHLDGVVTLNNLETGSEVARLPCHDSSAASILAFSPDQQRLVIAFNDERCPALVWDLAVACKELSDRGLDLPDGILQPRLRTSNTTSETRPESP